MKKWDYMSKPIHSVGDLKNALAEALKAYKITPEGPDDLFLNPFGDYTSTLAYDKEKNVAYLDEQKWFFENEIVESDDEDDIVLPTSPCQFAIEYIESAKELPKALETLPEEAELTPYGEENTRLVFDKDDKDSLYVDRYDFLLDEEHFSDPQKLE